MFLSGDATASAKPQPSAGRTGDILALRDPCGAGGTCQPQAKDPPSPVGGTGLAAAQDPIPAGNTIADLSGRPDQPDCPARGRPPGDCAPLRTAAFRRPGRNFVDYAVRVPANCSTRPDHRST